MARVREYADGKIVLTDAGEWILGIGADFPTASRGFPPNRALLFHTVTKQWYIYVDGAWSTRTDAEVTFGAAAHFEAGIHVHGAGDAGGIKWYAGGGDDTTEAHSHEGVITVDLDLAGASSAVSSASFIPPRTLVWRAAVEVLTTFTGGSVTKFDVGVTGGDLAGIFSDVALIDDGDFTANVSLAVVTGNNAAAGITVSAQTAGSGAATVTAGKVRVTLWTSSIDGPDGSAYA